MSFAAPATSTLKSWISEHGGFEEIAPELPKWLAKSLAEDPRLPTVVE